MQRSNPTMNKQKLNSNLNLTCKRGSVGQSEGLSIPRSSVRFRLKPDTSNFHEFELHRPSNKGTKLLLKVIKAIIIIIRFYTLDVIIGRHTWNCQIRTHIHTEIHTHTHTQKQKIQQQKTRCNNNQQTTVTHFGEDKRLHLESSKQNYYIISS